MAGNDSYMTTLHLLAPPTPAQMRRMAMMSRGKQVRWALSFGFEDQDGGTFADFQRMVDTLTASEPSGKGAKAAASPYVYHVTPESNLSEISEHGLLAGKGRKYYDDIPLSNYLTGPKGINFWKEEVTGEFEPPIAVLRVPRGRLRLVTDEQGKYDARAQAYRTGRDIPPELIELRGEDGRWRPLKTAAHWVLTAAGPEITEQGTELEPWSKKKNEYSPHPEYKQNEKGEYYTDETDEQARERYRKGHEWDQATLAAISLGKITHEQAYELGSNEIARPDWHSGPRFKPLPQTLYHVTTHLAEVRQHGLKTRYELGMQSGHGLGGGTNMAVSFTEDLDTARQIYSAIIEAIRVLTNRLTVEQMLDMAYKGTGAKQPWITHAIQWGGGHFVSSDWKPGEPYPPLFQAFLDKKKYVHPGWGTTDEKADEDMPGAEPIGDGWVGGDGKKRHYEYKVPITEDEYRDIRFDWFKTWLYTREEAGGPMNPLFFSTDIDALARIPESEIAILQFEPVPGALGTRESALGEWRTYTGKAVRFMGIVETGDMPAAKAAATNKQSFIPPFEEFLAQMGGIHQLFEDDFKQDYPDEDACLRDLKRMYGKFVGETSKWKFPLTIYREVTLPSIADLDMDKVGTSWTVRPVEEGAFWSDPMGTSGEPWILKAEVGPKSIDWAYTMWNRMYYAGTGEQEVTLDKGDPIKLVAVRRAESKEWQPFSKIMTAASTPAAAEPQVEKMRPEDVDEAVKVGEACFPEHAGVFGKLVRDELGNDFSHSYVARLDEKVIGGYFLGNRQLSDHIDRPETQPYKGKRGVEGVALFLLPQYRGAGLGRKLRGLPLSSGADYVWGQHYEDLNNLQQWVNFGRKHLFTQEETEDDGTVANVHYTVMDLKPIRAAITPAGQETGGAGLSRTAGGLTGWLKNWWRGVKGDVHLVRAYREVLDRIREGAPDTQVGVLGDFLLDSQIREAYARASDVPVFIASKDRWKGLGSVYGETNLTLTLKGKFEPVIYMKRGSWQSVDRMIKTLLHEGWHAIKMLENPNAYWGKQYPSSEAPNAFKEYWNRPEEVEARGMENAGFSSIRKKFRETSATAPAIPQTPYQSPIRILEPTETPQFKSWFGNSVVKDRNGRPKPVYHGSTHSFEKFDLSRATYDNHYGKGMYFTDSQEDVSKNYATPESPDLTNRVQLRAEEIVRKIEEDEERCLAYGTPQYERVMRKAKDQARKELMGGTGGMVYLTYLRIEHPVVVQEYGGTRFEINFNERTQQESGSGVKLWKKVLEAGNRLGIDGDAVWGDIITDKGPEFTAYDFEKRLRGCNAIEEGYDNPDFSAGVFIALVYQLMGFDGIVQKNADLEFSNMKMPSGTTHYIVWNPRQVKSAIGNKGTFSPRSPRMTAAQEGIEEVQWTAPLYHATTAYRAAKIRKTKNFDSDNSGGYNEMGYGVYTHPSLNRVTAWAGPGRGAFLELRFTKPLRLAVKSDQIPDQRGLIDLGFDGIYDKHGLTQVPHQVLLFNHKSVTADGTSNRQATDLIDWLHVRTRAHNDNVYGYMEGLKSPQEAKFYHGDPKEAGDEEPQLPSAASLKFYHGLPKKQMSAVIAHGLLTEKDESGRDWGPSVYLASDPNVAADYTGSKDGDYDWVVLEIDGSKLDEYWLRPDDWEFRDEWEGLDENDPWKKQYGQNWANCPWQVSYQFSRQVAYMRDIPPSAITWHPKSYETMKKAAPRKRGLPISDITQTPQFKAWFGNSEVVDKQGRPLVVYHGTKGSFDEFDHEHSGTIHFTTDPKFAGMYSGAMEWNDVNKAVTDHKKPLPIGANIMPCYLKCDQLFDFRESWAAYQAEEYFDSGEMDQWDFNRACADHYVVLEEELTDDQKENYDAACFSRQVQNGSWVALELRTFIRYIRQQGYDGVVMVECGAINYAVFDPRQVKSAVGNAGEFNPESASITASKQDFHHEELIEHDGWMLKSGRYIPLNGETHGEAAERLGLSDKEDLVLLEHDAVLKGNIRVTSARGTLGRRIEIQADSRINPLLSELLSRLTPLVKVIEFFFASDPDDYELFSVDEAIEKFSSVTDTTEVKACPIRGVLAALKPMPTTVTFEVRRFTNLIDIRAWTPDRLDNPHAQDERPVGYIDIGSYYQHPGDMYVDDVNVVEGWRGTGLGQQLYDRAIAEARKAGVPRLWASIDQTPEAEDAWNRLSQRHPVKYEGDQKYVDLKQSGEMALASKTASQIGPVYHGTPHLFDEFAPSKGQRTIWGLVPISVNSQVFFFTPSVQAARNWANNRAEDSQPQYVLTCEITMDNPVDMRTDDWIDEQVDAHPLPMDHLPNQLRTRTLLEALREYTEGKLNEIDWRDMGIDINGLEIIDRHCLSLMLDNKEVMDTLRFLKYDGVIYDEGEDPELGGVSYGVFSPSQVKILKRTKTADLAEPQSDDLYVISAKDGELWGDESDYENSHVFAVKNGKTCDAKGERPPKEMAAEIGMVDFEVKGPFTPDELRAKFKDGDVGDVGEAREHLGKTASKVEEPLYHVTYKSRIPDILEHGLLNNQEPNWPFRHSPARVHLTVGEGVDFWKGMMRTFIDGEVRDELAVVEVDPRELSFEKDYAGTDEAGATAYWNYGVPPSHIKVVASKTSSSTSNREIKDNGWLKPDETFVESRGLGHDVVAAKELGMLNDPDKENCDASEKAASLGWIRIGVLTSDSQLQAGPLTTKTRALMAQAVMRLAPSVRWVTVEFVEPGICKLGLNREAAYKFIHSVQPEESIVASKVVAVEEWNEKAASLFDRYMWMMDPRTDLPLIRKSVPQCRTHADWCKYLGIPLSDFDKILRGDIRVNTEESRAVIGTDDWSLYRGSRREKEWAPNEVIDSFKRSYPRFSGYEFYDDVNGAELGSLSGKTASASTSAEAKARSGFENDPPGFDPDSANARYIYSDGFVQQNEQPHYIIAQECIPEDQFAPWDEGDSEQCRDAEIIDTATFMKTTRAIRVASNSPSGITIHLEVPPSIQQVRRMAEMSRGKTVYWLTWTGNEGEGSFADLQRAMQGKTASGNAFLRNEWNPGDKAWFEYHCWEDPKSADADLWRHSHQQVTVLGKAAADGWIEELANSTVIERGESGTPRAYQVRFEDGLRHTAMEDELLTDRRGFFRPDPPGPGKLASKTDSEPLILCHLTTPEVAEKIKSEGWKPEPKVKWHYYAPQGNDGIYFYPQGSSHLIQYAYYLAAKAGVQKLTLVTASVPGDAIVQTKDSEDGIFVPNDRLEQVEILRMDDFERRIPGGWEKCASTVEPWMQTQREYLESQKTGHIPSDAYKSYSTSEGIASFIRFEGYPYHLETFTVRGIPVEIRRDREHNKYTRTDENGEIVYDTSGIATSFTDEEAKAKGYPIESANLGAFVPHHEPAGSWATYDLKQIIQPPNKGDDDLRSIQEQLGFGFRDVQYEMSRPTSYYYPKIYDTLVNDPRPEWKDFEDKEIYHTTLDAWEDRRDRAFRGWITGKLREYGYEPQGDKYKLKIGIEHGGKKVLLPANSRPGDAKASGYWRPVGHAANEFGTTGVWVVEEFQRGGLGERLLTLFHELNPRLAAKSMGQMTEAGVGLAKAHHRRMVREALAAGKPVPENVLRDYPELQPKTASRKKDYLDGHDGWIDTDGKFYACGDDETHGSAAVRHGLVAGEWANMYREEGSIGWAYLSQIVEEVMDMGGIRVFGHPNLVFDAMWDNAQIRKNIANALASNKGISDVSIEFHRPKHDYEFKLEPDEAMRWMVTGERPVKTPMRQMREAIASGPEATRIDCETPKAAGAGKAGDTLPGTLFRASYAPGDAIIGAVRKKKPITQYEATPHLSEYDFSRLLDNGGWVTNRGRPIAMNDPTGSHGETALDCSLCELDEDEEASDEYLGYAENAAMKNGHLRVDRDFGQLAVQAFNIKKSRRLITEVLRMMPFEGDVYLETGPHDHPTWQKNFHSSEDAASWLENL